jgi:hypothetical protein
MVGFKMMRLMSVLLLGLSLFGCGPYSRGPEPTPWLPVNPSGVVTEAVMRQSALFQKSHHLRFEDASAYWSEGSLIGVRVIYSTMDILDFCPARELLVDVVEGLTGALGESFEGFSPDQLEIYISFESYFTRYVDPYYVSWIKLYDGIGYFYMGTLQDYHNDWWHQRMEVYSDSLNFVNIQREINAEQAAQKAKTEKSIEEILNASPPR